MENKQSGKVKWLIIVLLSLFYVACTLESGGERKEPPQPPPPGYIFLKFDRNGGSGSPPPQQTVQIGTTLILPNADSLSRENHSFGGWNTNDAGTGINYPVGSSFTVPNEDTILYAQWTPQVYNVTFNADGGTPAPAPQTVYYNGTVTQPPAMTKNNYAFDGWYKEAALTNPWNFSADIVTGNITLYARWLKIFHTEKRTNDLDHVSSPSRDETVTPGLITDLLKESGYNWVKINVSFRYKAETIWGGDLRLQIASAHKTRELDRKDFQPDWTNWTGNSFSVSARIESLNSPTCEFMLLWSKRGVSDYCVGERTITVTAIQ